MIKVINSKELKNNDVDLVCTHCGRDYNIRNSKGNLIAKEGKDYVFEKENDEEWCICIECKNECDKNGLI